MYIYKLVLIAQIGLTLSPSLPLSRHKKSYSPLLLAAPVNCIQYLSYTGRQTVVCPCVNVHWMTLLISSSLHF